MTLLFATALFMSAILLFWVQPLVAKMLLPYFGGTPAVWNACMLFFQGMLLIGYAYVLLAAKWLAVRKQAVLHLAVLLLAALSLPVGPPEWFLSSLPAGTANPVLWLLACLLTTLGLPFFVLSASAPLLQKWFSKTSHPSAGDPYFLYAASNAGSLLALVAFPLLLEPNINLHQQSKLWAAAYGALGVIFAACAVVLWRSDLSSVNKANKTSVEERESRSEAEDQVEVVTGRRRLRWIALAFVPSSLVLGVTTYMTTDVAAVPLLWVIPLAIYLLTFVFAFAKKQLLPRAGMMRFLPGAALLVTLVLLSGATEPTWFLVLVHLIFFFLAALACHGQLADERPPTLHLAEYYLWIAVGGALGGIFNALLAPVLFDRLIEYPLAIVLACLLLPRRKRAVTEGDRAPGVQEDSARDRWLDVIFPAGVGLVTAGLALLVNRFEIETVESIAIVFGLPLLAINHLFSKRPMRFGLGLGAVMLGSSFYAEDTGRTLHAERNFYGTLRVTLDPAGESHRLYHGSTIHGRQFIDQARRCEPLSYYHRTGPLGSVFKAFNAAPATPHVAVIGLGTGASAAYAQPGQRWTFYEINPAVVGLARDRRFFTYLADCASAPVETIIGDARLQLREAPNNHYGLIVLDAFSSDAIPIHLLTREALELYLSKLAERGVLALHISNRSLNLQPVVGDLAKNANLSALIYDDAKYDPVSGKEPSQWVVLARSTTNLSELVKDSRWKLLQGRSRPEVWSDHFSGVVSVFKWLG